MDFKEKIKQLVEEIASLNSDVESKKVRIKLLNKAKKQYERLIQKAGEIEVPK